MAMSHDLSASPIPTYFIYRDVVEGQPYDPTATLSFFPPKDSDELFDALRAKYPHLKSHSERMRDATIEFLLEERNAEALSTNVSPEMPSLYDSMNENSPWQQSWPSASMTTLSSPEMTNFATPAFDKSPQIPQLVRQQSSAATPSGSQTPAIDQMTSVFSLSTSEQPKQRVRRKMTEAEKVEYRKRRIVKACDKCSKRKRKCVHNQPEMEGLKKSDDKSTHKITKPRHNIAKQPPAAEVSFSSNLTTADFTDSFATDGLIGGYEDFTLMFDEPTLDFNLDDYMTFDVPNFNTKPDNYRQNSQHSTPDSSRLPWNLPGSQSWNALDASAANSFSGHTQSFEATDDITGLMFPHGSQIYENPQSRRRCDSRQSLTDSTRSSGTNDSSSASLTASANADQIHVLEQFSSGRSGGLDASTQPTHTAHQHEQQSPSASSHVNSASDGRSSSHGDLGGNIIEGVPLLVTTGTDETPTNTALRRSRRPDVSVGRSAASATPLSNALRHRLRSDSALQSELSSTSATSSSSVSRTEHATTLEGRPIAARANLSSSQSSLGDNARNSERIIMKSPPLSSPLPTRSSPIAGESAPLLSDPAARSTTTRASASLSPQQTRASSALVAQHSPFDRTDAMPVRSSELFRLRNRITASLDEPTPSAVPSRQAVSLSAQANGGAYPRLATTASSSTSTALVTQQQARANSSVSTTSSSGTTSSADTARTLFTESDTKRYKDHHGRPTSLETLPSMPADRVAYATSHAAMAVIAIGALLLLTSSLVSSSLLLLATFAPISAFLRAQDQNSRHPSSRLSNMRSTAFRALASRHGRHRPSFENACALQRPVGCV